MEKKFENLKERLENKKSNEIEYEINSEDFDRDSDNNSDSDIDLFCRMFWAWHNHYFVVWNRLMCAIRFS